MREYRPIVLLVLIMAGVASVIGGTAILILYDTALLGQRQRLEESVQSQAEMIEAVIRYAESSGLTPEAARTSALSQVVDAAYQHRRMQSGEFVLGERQGDDIIFLLPAASTNKLPLPVPFSSAAAEPMRRALSGMSGSLIGRDYRGVMVVAAHRPVAGTELGAVAKIDLVDVRAPFIRAAFVVMALALVSIVLGTTLFFHICEPILERLRAGQRRFLELFDHMNSGVCVLQAVDDGSDFLILEFNRAAEHIEEIAASAIIEKPINQVFPGCTACGLLSCFQRVYATGVTESLSEVYYRDDRIAGWRDYHVYRLPGGEVVTVFNDITERKATEQRLREAQRMEVVGQLTSGLAHDFNNLLGVIIGNLQLLSEQRDITPESLELAEDALSSAERGAQLTHCLLAFARRQPLDPRPTDINRLVRDMSSLFRRTLPTTIEIRSLLTPALWPASIDRGQLEAALMNLVANAGDAMSDDGVLTIETSNVVIPSSDRVSSLLSSDIPAAESGVASGAYVVIKVRDTGTGMPRELIERIFEPFFTTKGRANGSGLGLSMVYGFVKQSGGHVNVDSAPGQGTTVTLYFPRRTGSGDDSEGTAHMRNDRESRKSIPASGD